MGSLAMALPAQGLRVPAVVGIAGPMTVIRKRQEEFASLMHEGIARWFGPSQ
jgi:hypothetical protein